MAVDLAGAGLKYPGAASLGQAKNVDHADGGGLDGFDGVVLVRLGGGGAGQIVDLVGLDIDRVDNVVADQFEPRVTEKVADIVLVSSEEVVEADDFVTAFDEAIAEMRTEKSGSAGDKNGLHGLRLVSGI